MVEKFFAISHTRWCEGEKDPRLTVTIGPIGPETLREERACLIADKVTEMLLKKGIKNLLGSAKENLRMLMPIILEAME